MKKSLVLIMIVVLLTSIFVACNSEKELEKVVFTLDWTPNTNHTGIYVAQDNGYFEEMGIEIEIIQPSSGTASQLVATGKAQFGISAQESVIFARIEEVPVVSIAAIIQHNTSGFASLASKGIETAKDFEGKKYGGWGSPIENATIKALVEQDGGDFSKVEILTSGAADFFALSESDIDFAWIFEGWTGIEAKIKGIDINYLDLGKSDSDLDFYTPVIITSEALISDNPELVKRFMEAVSLGYEYAIENPTEAGNILLNNAPELDEELVLESQKFLSERYQDDASQWGLQKMSVWENYTNWLLERELIPNTIELDKAFTAEFLPKE